MEGEPKEPVIPRTVDYEDPYAAWAYMLNLRDEMDHEIDVSDDQLETVLAGLCNEPDVEAITVLPAISKTTSGSFLPNVKSIFVRRAEYRKNLAPQALAHYITRATSAGLKLPNGAPFLSHLPHLLDHIAERIAQSTVGAGMSGISERVRFNNSTTLLFWSGVIGEIARLNGSSRASAYGHFNTPQGNQIEMFLKAVGYIK